MSGDLVKQGRSVERDLNNGFPVTSEKMVIIQQMANRIEELEAKLARAVRLMDLSIELARWELNESLKHEVIGFVTELKGQDDE